MKTFFYSLKRSLFDTSYYKDIVKAKFVFSFKYLLVLSFFFMLIRSMVLGLGYIGNRHMVKPAVSQFYQLAKRFYPKDLELRIRNGRLLTNVNTPYFIDFAQGAFDSRHLIAIDTNGSIDNYPDYNSYVLVTRNALVYPESKIFYFTNIKNDFTMDRNKYDDFLNIIKPYADKATLFTDILIVSSMFFLTVFGSIFLASNAMFGLLILTFFVWIAASLLKIKYKYSTLYQMGMHAVTWPLLVSQVFSYLPGRVPFAYFIVYFFWMGTVVLSLRKKTKR